MINIFKTQILLVFLSFSAYAQYTIPNNQIIVGTGTTETKIIRLPITGSTSTWTNGGNLLIKGGDRTGATTTSLGGDLILQGGTGTNTGAGVNQSGKVILRDGFGNDQLVAHSGVTVKTSFYVTLNTVLGSSTTIPTTGYKLNVWGKIRANEVVVNTTGADFVFDKNYTLRSLAEVERFIKEHKHLPEIPSASEMQENGVGVSELQTKLLQKVEELTLYVIEQNKQYEALKQECERLKMMVEKSNQK